MKKKLLTLTKYFKWLYNIYYFFGNLFLKILKIFVKPDDHLILFNSFGGKKYDDSPKAIYEAMINDERFVGYKFVWAFHQPDKFHIAKGKQIKTDNLFYFITALKARVWITNSGIERGLNFKGKHTYYFNTWHGTPIKYMGIDISNENLSYKEKKSINIVDTYTSQSMYEAEIFSRVFHKDISHFLICGLHHDKININQLKKKIGIPNHKKVILYAPTFREYERDDKHNCVLSLPMHFDKWESELKDDYVVLIRAHYEVSKLINFDESSIFINVSDYPVLNELMICSDMLISDYSSIFFDYSILNKPMICWTYDYDEYNEKRGMYFDIREYLNGGNITEDDLFQYIKNFNNDDNLQKVKIFREKFVEAYGNATNISINCIYEQINKI